MTSIYEAYEQYLPLILEDLTQKIKTAALEHKKTTSFKLYEHFHARIKTADSMAEKCQRKNLPLSAESALKQIRDAIVRSSRFLYHGLVLKPLLQLRHRCLPLQ